MDRRGESMVLNSEKIVAGMRDPTSVILLLFQVSGKHQGWFASMWRYANSKGFLLGFWLPPFGSTVTKTASICARALGSSNLSTHRFFEELSTKKMPRLSACCQSGPRRPQAWKVLAFFRPACW